MSGIKVIGQHKSFASFEGMTWELPGEYMSEVEYALRWGTPTKQQQLYAAGVIAAYRQMIADSDAKRRNVIRALRAAARTIPEQQHGT